MPNGKPGEEPERDDAAKNADDDCCPFSSLLERRLTRDVVVCGRGQCSCVCLVDGNADEDAGSVE